MDSIDSENDSLREKEHLLEEIKSLRTNISKKNEIIDSQRVKLKRYEFCVQEAILFLGKPVLAYSDWLNGIGQKEKSPQSLAEKQIGLSNAVNTINSINITNTGVNLDIKALECIKLALNYLVNARNSINKSNEQKLDQSIENNPLNPNMDSEKRDQILNGIDKIKGNHARTVSQNQNEVFESHPRRMSETLEISNQTKISARSYNSISAQNKVEEEDDQDGDIAVLHLKQVEPKVQKKNCVQCTQRMLTIDKLYESINENQSLINTLSNQIKQEQEAKERILVSKEILEQELEDLTEQLFDQANNMVIEEAKNREDLEHKNISLTAELSGAMKRAQGREDEIQDLKRIINALKSAKIKAIQSTSSLNVSPSMGILPNLSVEDVPKGVFSFENLPATVMTNNIYIDGIIYGEVQDHISCTLMSSEINTSTQFMKRVIYEDVEPCLFYNYSFSGSLKSIGSGGPASSFRKKFLESVIKCTCQMAKDQQASPYNERNLEKQNSRLKCALCTVVRDVTIKFSFGVKPEEIQVCSFCKDRVLACKDFFSYNNFLRQNKPNSSILNIFRCLMWLRKRYREK